MTSEYYAAEYCDNCGEFTDELFPISSLLANIASANKGESAVLCTTCNRNQHDAMLKHTDSISKTTELNCQVYHTFNHSQLTEEMNRISEERSNCESLKHRASGEERVRQHLDDQIEFLDHYSTDIQNMLD